MSDFGDFFCLQTPFETPIQTPLPGNVDQFLYHMPTPAGLSDNDDPIDCDGKPGKPNSYVVSSVNCSRLLVQIRVLWG